MGVARVYSFRILKRPLRQLHALLRSLRALRPWCALRHQGATWTPKQSLGDGLQKREIDPYTNCLDHCTVVEAIAYSQNTRHQKHRFVSAISSLAHVKLVL